MSLLSTATDTLVGAGYSVLPIQALNGPKVIFEDESLLGMAAEFETVEQLLEGWQNAETWFLSSYATALRNAPIKAWNAYTVLLTEAPATPEQDLHLGRIEQNFRGTRKIARHSVVGRKSLIEALLTLLPLQSDYSLQRQNFEERLSRQIPLHENARKILFSEAGQGEDLAEAMLREI